MTKAKNPKAVQQSPSPSCWFCKRKMWLSSVRQVVERGDQSKNVRMVCSECYVRRYHELEVVMPRG